MVHISVSMWGYVNMCLCAYMSMCLHAYMSMCLCTYVCGALGSQRCQIPWGWSYDDFESYFVGQNRTRNILLTTKPLLEPKTFVFWGRIPTNYPGSSYVDQGDQTSGAEILSLKPLTWPVKKNFVQDTGQPDGLALAITILLGQFPVWVSKLAKRNPRLEFASLSQQSKVTSFRLPSSQSGNNSVAHMACVSQESIWWIKRNTRNT